MMCSTAVRATIRSTVASPGSFDGANTGNDTYLFASGYGHDLIHNYHTTTGTTDTLRLVGLTAADVTMYRKNDDLLIDVNGTGDELTVSGWGLGAAYRVERIEFADGSVMQGTALDNIAFLGTAGNDSIVGSDGKDLIKGLGGSDVLYGGFGDDVLDGGAGNDVLYGGFSGAFDGAGAGNDTYVFGRGYGQDVIYDYDSTRGNSDTIRLAGLNQADVTLYRKDSDLYVSVNGTNDTLAVAGWGLGSSYRVERIEFADGSVMQGAALNDIAFLGTAGNDSIAGTDGRDVIKGLAGDDWLYGGYGDDVLDGGAGNDVLYGGYGGAYDGANAGNDTYLFASGYGHDAIHNYHTSAGTTDTIQLSGLNQSDVFMFRQGNDLQINVNGTTDQLTVADWGSGAAWRVDRIQFADGSVMQGAALENLPYLGTEGNDAISGSASNDVILGLAGNDTLTGAGGDDTLDGGTGNDSLNGGVGSDTYIFARGYGQDTVTDNDSTPGSVDTIKLVGLNQSDVTLRRDANSMYINVNGTTDQMQVVNWGAGAAYRIERVQFADNSYLDAAALANVPYLGSAGNDSMTGTADAEVFKGLAGNDTITAGAGDDLIDGGDGNDILKGEDGNDGLLGGAGTDMLYGGNGNDILDGGVGNDRMYGGTGDDVYWVDSSTDQANEAANEGSDTVMAKHQLLAGEPAVPRERDAGRVREPERHRQCRRQHPAGKFRCQHALRRRR